MCGKFIRERLWRSSPKIMSIVGWKMVSEGAWTLAGSLQKSKVGVRAKRRGIRSGVRGEARKNVCNEVKNEIRGRDRDGEKDRGKGRYSRSRTGVEEPAGSRDKGKDKHESKVRDRGRNPA